MRQLSDDEIDELVEWGQHNPIEWMEEVLNARMWDLQAKVIESVRDNRRTMVRSCHGIGKSFLAAHLALWFLLTFPNSIVATTAPTFRQVKKILWQEVGKAVAKAPAPLGGKPLQTEYVIAPGWYAFGFSSDDPTSAQGLHAEHVLLIYDEASGLSAELWEALEGALTSEHTRLLAIGNPTDPASPFAREFKAPGATKFAISAFDTPNFTTFGITLDDVVKGTWEKKIGKAALPMPWLITPDWVADKVKRWGVESPAFKSRVMAAFPDIGDDTLIPLSWLEVAQQKDVALDAKDKNLPDELGVDVARFGSDETVIGRRRGYVERCTLYRQVSAHRGIDTMATAGAVQRALSTTGARLAKIDANGVGGGVFDRLLELKRPVADMNAVGAAHDPDRFINARAEWFWSLREAFEAGKGSPSDPKVGVDIDPADEDLFGQLSNLKFKLDSKGRIQIESKADMKARGLPSPDRADTMAMAYASPSKSASGFIAAMRAVQGG